MDRKKRVSIVVALIVLIGVALMIYKQRGGDPEPSPMVAGSGSAPIVVGRTGSVQVPAPAREPLPGQGRAIVEAIDGAGTVTGRVVNWSTGDGVANADVTFAGQGGAMTVRSRTDGLFELAPAAPGRFTLVAVAAQGFLPFAPELQHSGVYVEVTRERAVRGVTVFVFPAIDYHGRVVDKAGAPVAGARVRLLGTPAGEQAIDKLETEWVADKAGKFTFHAADEAVFEAVKGTQRGWARLDGDVMLTREMVIAIGDAAARDATISGRVVDGAGQPLAEVLVRADPDDTATRGAPSPGEARDRPARATAFATTAADGTFTLEALDRGPYDLEAQRDDSAPAHREAVPGGTRGLELVLERGLPIAGAVKTTAGEAVPAYTLLVSKREGALRLPVIARSIVDANGRFEVRVAPGDYDVRAWPSGWAPSAPVEAAAGARDVALVVTAGATLRGTVVAADGSGPISYARVMREASGGGASAQPANAGTVTRSDGTFELTGIPPGPLSFTVNAGGFHPKIEAGLVASDGATLGPLAISLARLAEGEKPQIELVGIGVALSADRDGLRVDRVIAGGGAAAAGIVAGDHVVAVDGLPTVKLGVEGAVAKIRGVEGTTIAITLQRGDQKVELVVERRKIRA